MMKLSEKPIKLLAISVSVIRRICSHLASRNGILPIEDAFFPADTAVVDITGVSDDDILARQYKDTINGLTSGNTYYVRVGARTANANNKFNYSEIVKITVP